MVERRHIYSFEHSFVALLGWQPVPCASPCNDFNILSNRANTYDKRITSKGHGEWRPHHSSLLPPRIAKKSIQKRACINACGRNEDRMVEEEKDECVGSEIAKFEKVNGYGTSEICSVQMDLYSTRWNKTLSFFWNCIWKTICKLDNSKGMSRSVSPVTSLEL